jgi:hypothetical protein
MAVLFPYDILVTQYFTGDILSGYLKISDPCRKGKNMPLRFNVKRRISSVNISFFEIEN